MSKSVTLGDGAINESGDRITIHLMTPADFPAGIQIRWPVAAPVRPRTVHRDRGSRAMKVLADAVTNTIRKRASCDEPGTLPIGHVPLLAGLRDLAVDLGVGADIVEQTGNDGHHGRADFGAIGRRTTEVPRCTAATTPIRSQIRSKRQTDWTQIVSSTP